MGHLVQPSCRSRVTYSRLHRTASRRVLNISREVDSATSLGSLFLCSVTLRGKRFFLMFSWNFLCFILCPLPLVLLLGTTEKSFALSFWHPPFRYADTKCTSHASVYTTSRMFAAILLLPCVVVSVQLALAYKSLLWDLLVAFPVNTQLGVREGDFGAIAV